MMRASEARKASYFFASFFTSFLFLLSLRATGEDRYILRQEDALLQVINGHVLELDLLGTVDVGGIGENADGHAGTGDVGELDGARETLVPLGVVVLETNLELDGLDEVTLLLLGRREQFTDGAPHAWH